MTERMIKASIGDGITLFDILERVFGRRRTRAAIQEPHLDPEFVDFAMLLDAQVHKAWKERGVSRRQGPYVR